MTKIWQVHKFGGTSVLNAERIRNCAQILLGLNCPNKAIVVSALKGTTDDLLEVVRAAALKQSPTDLLAKVRKRHDETSTALLSPQRNSEMQSILAADFQIITDNLARLNEKNFVQMSELISGYGEIWSAQLLNFHLKDLKISSDWLDARKIVVVNHQMGQAVVQWPATEKNFKTWYQVNEASNVVITGFVATTADGVISTLGRNGSDFSASIFGALFPTEEVIIWTDVDGVLSADPRIVPDAVVLQELSYSEVSELAYFGAKVLHPSTMSPLVAKKIPLWIKNSLRPEAPGTKIHAGASSDRTVRGFTTIGAMAMLNVEGAGMVGIPGFAERLFACLRQAQINVVLISQASSEHSICFAIAEQSAEAAKKALGESFADEIQNQLIEKIQVTKSISILAAVGDNMAQVPGVSGKLFSALGQAGVNVRAIAQGSSERNISVVIDSKDAERALRVVHSAFVSKHLSIAVGLIGIGTIGKTFLKQLQNEIHRLREEKNIDLQVLALADSKKMLLSSKAIDLGSWANTFEQQAQSIDVKALSRHLSDSQVAHSVLIEATASEILVPFYGEWLAAGIHIISPNKKANSGSFQQYSEIQKAAQKNSRHFLYSTNVGAGLPVIQTLRDFRRTGDQVQLIQGIFSGTLSFLFSQFSSKTEFSEIVLEAARRGYTEPDPREDLSGQDVMRKLVILAREAGMAMEPQQVSVTGLVPAEMAKLTKEEFIAHLPILNASMREKFVAAEAKNEVLRFVGSLEQNGKASVGLHSFAKNHAFANVQGTDNIVLFKTNRYAEQPLVVRGPGAGPEVTAAGVFADLLRLCQYLGAIL